MSTSLLLPILLGLLVILAAGYFLFRDRKGIAPAAYHNGTLVPNGDPSTRSIPTRVAEKIFEPADFEFVRNSGSPEALNLFQRERRRLALLWLKHVRQQAGRVVRNHAQKVRMSKRLDPAGEFEIAVRYYSFLGICGLAWLLLHFLGPVTIRHLVRYAAGLSSRLPGLTNEATVALGGESDPLPEAGDRKWPF